MSRIWFRGLANDVGDARIDIELRIELEGCERCSQGSSCMRMPLVLIRGVGRGVRGY